MLRAIIIVNLLFYAVSAVSSPEIASKTAKTASTSTQSGQKSSSADLLNTLNGVSSNYDSGNSYSFQPSTPILKSYAGPLYQYPSQQQSLKPQLSPSHNNDASIETEFQPMHPSAAHLGATPFIMQYMPHGQMHGGVQYLQLIPTRPLLVPISPYLAQMAHSPQAAAYQGPVLGHAYPGRAAVGNAAHAERSPSNAVPYSLPPSAYAPQHAGQDYRSGRATDLIEASSNVFLNMNEYIPGPNQKPAMPIRGRP